MVICNAFLALNARSCVFLPTRLLLVTISLPSHLCCASHGLLCRGRNGRCRLCAFCTRLIVHASSGRCRSVIHAGSPFSPATCLVVRCRSGMVRNCEHSSATWPYCLPACMVAVHWVNAMSMPSGYAFYSRLIDGIYENMIPWLCTLLCMPDVVTMRSP